MAMVNGKWQVASGKWQMATANGNGKWQFWPMARQARSAWQVTSSGSRLVGHEEDASRAKEEKNKRD